MLRLLALMVAIGAAAAVARGVVYGLGPALSASPLEGHVLLSAFTGGVALVFSRAFLPVLLPYLTILFGDLKNEGSAGSVDWRWR